MPWPQDNLTNTQTDEGGDNPSLARAIIDAAITAIKGVIAARNQADGVCGLNASAKVDDGRIGRGEPNGVCDLDADGLINQNRYRLGGGLAVDSDSRQLKVAKGAEHAASSVAASANKVLTGLSVDGNGLVREIESIDSDELRPSNTQYSPWFYCYPKYVLNTSAPGLTGRPSSNSNVHFSSLAEADDKIRGAGGYALEEYPKFYPDWTLAGHIGEGIPIPDQAFIRIDTGLFLPGIRFYGWSAPPNSVVTIELEEQGEYSVDEAGRPFVWAGFYVRSINLDQRDVEHWGKPVTWTIMRQRIVSRMLP